MNVRGIHMIVSTKSVWLVQLELVHEFENVWLAVWFRQHGGVSMHVSKVNKQ